MQTLHAFAHLIALPENLSARAALEDLLAHPLLFLHGPTGSGKTALVQTLASDACLLSANDFPQPVPDADLLVVEDLQHLRPYAVETLVQLIDRRLAQQAPMVFTALAGPRHLCHRGTPLPLRLTNRLASGLVVALEPWQAPSRLLFLREMAQRRGLDLPEPTLAWLAEHLTAGGRQLEAALHQVESLQRLLGRPLSLQQLREQFQAQADAQQPTVARITAQVSDYFRVEPRQLRSARRSRALLLARQVSMYLARRLTPLSLQQIGAFFGGRDHTTVLHACRKVEQALQSDAALSGAVRRIHAELA